MTSDPGATRPSRSDRSVWWTAMLLSAAVHALVLLLWPRLVPILVEAREPDGARSAAVGEPMRLVSVAPPRRRPVPVTERPVRALAAPGVALPGLARAPTRPDLTPAVGTAAPPPVALRIGRAENGGDAGLVAPETHARPVARTILGDWQAPRSLYGMGVTVRVHVDTVGRPTGFVELVPPTPDSVANREILYRVRQLDYAPALRNGRPVPAWAEIALVFCRSSVTATSPAPPVARLPDRCTGGH